MFVIVIVGLIFSIIFSVHPSITYADGTSNAEEITQQAPDNLLPETVPGSEVVSDPETVPDANLEEPFAMQQPGMDAAPMALASVRENYALKKDVKVSGNEVPDGLFLNMPSMETRQHAGLPINTTISGLK